MKGHIVVPADGVKGIDINGELGLSQLTKLKAQGYKFVLRYIWRVNYAAGDLTASEAQTILDAGMGLMLVQHVVSETAWMPTGARGQSYGNTAAKAALDLAIPPGTMIWLDLEGVAINTKADDIVAYANAWHSAVAAAGFLPGIYIGWRCGLSAQQLYHKLRFTHFWAAYNLNRDQFPAVRGAQMIQAEVSGQEYQSDLCLADNLGGRVQILVGDSWLA